MYKLQQMKLKPSSGGLSHHLARKQIWVHILETS